MDLRSYIITRIDIFRGRAAGSLDPSELQRLAPWMAKVQEGRGRVDDEIRLHFAAFQQAMQEKGIQWEPEQQSHLPESAASPQQNFVMPLAQLPKSETPEASWRPLARASIASRRSSVSEDVLAREEDPPEAEENTPKENWRRIRMTRPTSFRNRLVGSLSVEELKHLRANWMARIRDSPLILLTGDDLALYRALEEALIYHGLESPSLPVQRKESPQEQSEPSLKTPILPIAAKEHFGSSGDRRDETCERSAAVEQSGEELRQMDPRPEAPSPKESDRYQRAPLQEIIGHYGIAGIHPAAELLPEIGDEEFQQMCCDIKTNGLLHPPSINDEQILLDGRTRLQLAWALGLDFKFEQLNPPDELAYIVSENIRRRHLSAGQRAMVAERIANLGHGGDRKTDDFKIGDPILKTRDEAARLAGSTPEAISQARLIRQWGTPEEVRAVEAGTETLEQAYKRVQKKRETEGRSAPKRKRKSRHEAASAELETPSDNSDATKSAAPRVPPAVALPYLPVSEISTREDHLRVLWSLFDLLLKGQDESYGEAFLKEQQLDIAKFWAAWPRFGRLAVQVKAFAEKQPPPFQS
jgi:hypothetical protein